MAGHKQGSGKALVREAREAVDACAGLNVRTAARLITRFLETRMGDTGLSLAQFGLMAHIAAAEDDTINGLVARTGLDQTTLSRNLHALERGGLVEIATVENDLRRRAVWLTEKGARALEAALPAWHRAHAALSQVIDPGAVRKLAGSASKLTESRNRGRPVIRVRA
jgi:DNA-binding MarR family transcriptional regulator